jgi:serine/threonine protein kinase
MPFAPHSSAETIDVRHAHVETAARNWVDCIANGDLIGRYIVRSILGAGGMGVVFEAYDPMLDRRVALKVMRNDSTQIGQPGDGESTQARGLLVREANGMAQLSHPHVMPVFDVGWVEGRFFLAMELNDGSTFREWLSERARTWIEIVEMLAQAAQGLAAIHRAGIVHCDFKPANLLIDRTGVLRISDFGLARKIADMRRPSFERPASADIGELDTLNRSGSQGYGGTLSYMSPEQYDGAPLDPASDQYSFFVTLHEALLGNLPPDVARRHLVHGSHYASKSDEPKSSARQLPSWLSAALARGLRPRSDERFADLCEVHRVLVDGVRRHRRRWIVPTLSTLALGMAIAFLALLPETSDPCDTIENQAKDIWNEGVAHQLEARYLATSISEPTPVWNSLRQALDEQMAEWKHTASEQCHHAQASLQTDLCLRTALGGIQSATQIFLSADETTLESPSLVLSAIPQAGDCVTGHRSDGGGVIWPKDAATANTYASLRSDILHLRMLGRAGNLSGVREYYDKVNRKLADHDYLPIRAELELQMGLANAFFAEAGPARQHLNQAMLYATASNYDEVLGWSLTALIYDFGAGREAYSGDDEKQVFARSAISRQGDSPLLFAEWLNNVGIHDLRAQQPVRAHAKFVRAKAIAGHLSGYSYLGTMERLNNIAITFEAMGDVEQAEHSLRYALSTVDKIGDHWPARAGSLLTNLGRTSILRGRYDDAEKELFDALRSSGRVDGRLTGDSEYACSNLEWLYLESGRHDKIVMLRKICPWNDLGIAKDAILDEIWTNLFVVRALADRGHYRAASELFAQIEKVRNNRFPAEYELEFLAVSQLMAAAAAVRDYNYCLNLGRIKLPRLRQSTAQDSVGYTRTSFLREQVRFAFLADHQAAIEAGKWGFAPNLSSEQIDGAHDDYLEAQSRLGLSHPAIIAPTLVYLDTLQARGDVTTYAQVLQRALDEDEYWRRVSPRRFLHLLLTALRFYAAHGADEALLARFKEFREIYDRELDDPAAVSQALSTAHRLAAARFPEASWLSELGEDARRARDLATDRQSVPFSDALVEQLISQVGRDPSTARIAAHRFR